MMTNKVDNVGGIFHRAHPLPRLLGSARFCVNEQTRNNPSMANMAANKNKERGEVLLKENSDGLQCVDRISKCKDAVCFIFAKDSGTVRLE